MTDLSVCIPARNEEFLALTVQDVIQHARADTEVIVVMDGYWADPPVPDHPRVIVLHEPVSIGQRAATNKAVQVASGKWVMKLDAHCSMEENFDAVLLADAQEHWTTLPVMQNLHAYDWVCEKGHHIYQGPVGPCRWPEQKRGQSDAEYALIPRCQLPTHKEIMWDRKAGPNSWTYRFDTEPHFQYWGELKKRPRIAPDFCETMSLQGSCFMIRRDRYLALNLCDETWGSWGSQGIEVAVKSWLSGGQVVVNLKTHYGHMFRTQKGFRHPYPLSEGQVEFAKAQARKLFISDFPGKIRPFSWLLEHFWPIPGWEIEDLERIKDAESDPVLHRQPA